MNLKGCGRKRFEGTEENLENPCQDRAQLGFELGTS
jgi:hypothetical protein